jgi:hypothetical protein
MDTKHLKFITLSIAFFALGAVMLLLEAGFYLPIPGLLVLFVAGLNWLQLCHYAPLYQRPAPTYPVVQMIGGAVLAIVGFIWGLSA